MNPNKRADHGVDEEGHSYPGSETAYSEDGVDLTVIRWMLSMTPEERLETLQNHIRSVMRIRGEETSA
ncbi:MAG: hypothetical protein AABY87_10100 [bacterium]